MIAPLHTDCNPHWCLIAGWWLCVGLSASSQNVLSCPQVYARVPMRLVTEYEGGCVT